MALGPIGPGPIGPRAYWPQGLLALEPIGPGAGPKVISFSGMRSPGSRLLLSKKIVLGFGMGFDIWPRLCTNVTKRRLRGSGSHFLGNESVGSKLGLARR